MCQSSGILDNCNSDATAQQNHMTMPLYCHECVKEVQRYLWYKFEVSTINATNVIMKYQPRTKVISQA